MLQETKSYRDEKVEKIISACEQIDDKKINFIKKVVFLKLLDCLDINVL